MKRLMRLLKKRCFYDVKRTRAQHQERIDVMCGKVTECFANAYNGTLLKSVWYSKTMIDVATGVQVNAMIDTLKTVSSGGGSGSRATYIPLSQIQFDSGVVMVSLWLVHNDDDDKEISSSDSDLFDYY